MDWHQRFLAQAGWSRNIRRYIMRQLHLDLAHRVLEVGCGTGAILSESKMDLSAQLYGLDLRLDFLQPAHASTPGTSFSAGNALSLPFLPGSFDAVFCHYLLLWLDDPVEALKEMRRVTRPGGFVIAFAEPDYGGRVDFPEILMEVGRLQTTSLQQQGADPNVGRKLRSLLTHVGLKNVVTGVISGTWNGAASPVFIESEWKMLRNDLKDLASTTDLQHWQELDRQAWASGERILFVPTFYAYGQVP